MLLLLSLLTSELLIYLGFLVYFHERKSASNKIFLAYSLIISIWSITNYFSLTVSPEKSLVWIRLVLFWAVPHVFLFFFFVLNFPNSILAVTKKITSFLLGLMLFLMGLTLSPFVFKNITTNNGSATPTPGVLMPYFVLSLIAVIFITFYYIIKKYGQAFGLEKKQWASISIGLISTYTLLISLVFIAVTIFNNTSFVAYSPLFILPLFIGMAYAILKHRLLNTKVFATEILAFFLILFSTWQILLAKDILSQIFQVIFAVILVIFSIFLIRSVLIEIRQREQLEILDKELQEANVKLKALDQARAEFITIASHQLRTPPATVKWYLSSVLDGDYGALKPEQKDILEKTNRTNNSLISLIDDMLNVSRIERGKMEFLFEQVSLLDLAKITFEQLEPIAKEKKLMMSFNFRPKTKFPKLMADKEKIRQVMNNLIDNALKYTKQGTVAVELNVVGGDIKFSVTDSGKGISPDQQTSIFEKYTRGKESIKQSAGLGLGLYVAKIIVGQHKGKIWAESPGEGKGSTFAFTVPINNNLKETTLVDLAKNQG
ncbi:MAG: HAMP domain-containing sensor histidine kinase [Candidatus Doudnabacteria bacterium]|jgi:signal transduction histidine kinase